MLTCSTLSDVPNFEVIAPIVSAHAERERDVWTGGGGVQGAEFEVVLANKRRLAGFNVPNFEALVLRDGYETAGALGTQSETGARFTVGVQLPDGFLVVPRVDVVHVAGLGARQEAVRVEVVPHDSLDLALYLPALGALAPAVVHARPLVTTSRQECLYLEWVELETLHFFRVSERRRHGLLAHVPQQDRVISRTACEQVSVRGKNESVF